MIVIDASSLSKYILMEDNWREVEAEMAEPVYSLDFVTVEVANSLWKTIYLYKTLPEADLSPKLEALEMAHDKLLKIESSNNYIKEALKISAESKTAIYDSLYVAQAIKYGKLLTSDKRQSGIATKLGIETTFIK